MKTISISILSMSAGRLANLANTLTNMESVMMRVKKHLSKQGIQCDFRWHIDIMDGNFVEQISMCPQLIEAIKASVTLPVDWHFMTMTMDKYPDWLHQETCYLHLGSDCIMEHAEQSDARYNLVFNLNEQPTYQLLNECDSVMLMSVVPGKGGQQYQSVHDKIDFVKKYCKDNDTSIEVAVDGGINLDSIYDCIEADKVVIGSAITGLSYEHMHKFLVDFAKVFCV